MKHFWSRTRWSVKNTTRIQQDGTDGTCKLNSVGYKWSTEQINKIALIQRMNQDLRQHRTLQIIHWRDTGDDRNWH